MWVTVFLGDTAGNKRSEYSAYVFPRHPWTQIHLLFHYFFPDSINTDIFIILHVCMTSDFHLETLVKDPRPRSYRLKETGRAHRFNLQMVAWVERTQECGFLALMVTGCWLERLRVTCAQDGPKRLCVRSLRLAALTADGVDALRSKAERTTQTGGEAGCAGRHSWGPWPHLLPLGRLCGLTPWASVSPSAQWEFYVFHRYRQL